MSEKPCFCRVLQHLNQIKVLIEYGCKHITKIFQSYKIAIKCKLMFCLEKLVQFRKEKIKILARSGLSFVNPFFLKSIFVPLISSFENTYD